MITFSIAFVIFNMNICVIGSSFSRRLRGKSMYHMTRGCDESSRLVSEPATTSSSVPNLTLEAELPPVEVRPTTYGSIENTLSGSSETEPLISAADDRESITHDPKA